MNSGAFASGGWRTSGSATSPPQTSPGQPIALVEADVLNGDVANYNHIDILDASDDSVITSTINPITSNVSLVAADFDNGFAGTAIDWKIRPRWIGAGLKSIALDRLAVTYASPSGHGMLLSTHRNRLAGVV